MPNPLLSLASSTARMLPAPIRQWFYRLGPLTRLIRRSLNRAAPTGLSEVSIAAGTLKGYLIQLDMQTEKDYWLGNYETNLETAIRDWVKQGMLVYDVGANIGYVSLLFTFTLGKTGQVFAFEALPANIERLKTNVTLNSLQNQIKVIHSAVVDTPASVPFLVHPSNGMGKVAGSAGRKEHYLEEILVPGTSLDHFVYDLGNPPPTLVKMDIEGGEVLALPGMKRLLAEFHPLIFLELHGEQAARTTWHTLTQAGYKLYRMIPGYPRIPAQDALEWKEYLIARWET
ncbi:MAG TPA: FkbM family methyltransferase [Anaerolineales bacterium]|nr:FkbM family methyltransferase [Anaerolineales bacterium]